MQNKKLTIYITAIDNDLSIVEPIYGTSREELDEIGQMLVDKNREIVDYKITKDGNRLPKDIEEKLKKLTLRKFLSKQYAISLNVGIDMTEEETDLYDEVSRYFVQSTINQDCFEE